MDLAKLSSYNKGFKYLLTCIDVLSRYAWVVPLTDKTGKTLKDVSGHFQIWAAVVICIETRPPVFLVKDDHGEILEGTFYAEEIQKVINQDDVYKIQSVPKKRRNGRRVQYLVKWFGYPESVNNWIFKPDLQKRGVAV